MPKKAPFISIVGTTSVGKSEAAFRLADALSLKFSQVFVISADSKQVYRGLEILTGADIPVSYTRTHDDSVCAHDFFVKENVFLFGISCGEVDQEWSLAHFRELALPLIERAQAGNIPVILVGGTGLYHEQLFATQTPDVPPNIELRAALSGSTAAELYERLASAAPLMADQMNNSDKHNPRRLLRALEKAAAGFFSANGNLTPQGMRQHYIGLHKPLEVLESLIQARIEKRLEQGALREVATVIQKNYSKLVMGILGFAECASYVRKEMEYQQLLTQWALKERQYAKRQITWWKNKEAVRWIDACQPEWLNTFLSEMEQK